MTLSGNTYCEPALIEPTGAYLTGETITEATKLSIDLNNEILRTPTNPHVGRMYRISFLDHELKWALPSSVFGNTNLRHYFLSLLLHQSVRNLIDPKDFSLRRKKQLQGKYQRALDNSSYTPTAYQMETFFEVINLLSLDVTLPTKDLIIQVTADQELVVVKLRADGSIYLLVGREEFDVSFINILPSPGKYISKHLSESGETLESIVNAFLAA